MIAVGAGLTVQNMAEGGGGSIFGKFILLSGFLFLLYMFAGWFSSVIAESMEGKYSDQMSRSFRQGMRVYFLRSCVFAFLEHCFMRG